MHMVQTSHNLNVHAWPVCALKNSYTQIHYMQVKCMVIATTNTWKFVACAHANNFDWPNWVLVQNIIVDTL